VPVAKVRAMSAAVIPIKKRPDSLTRLKASARKLFVERGYHATRPQDIAREAGLGHGTFYLHYPDKRACFLAFVEDARWEMNAHLASARTPDSSLEEMIAATLNAIYDYSDTNPGVLRAAMTDEMVIDAEGAQAVPLLVRWGEEWSALLLSAQENGQACKSYNAEIIGQAIVGALHQTGCEASRGQLCRKQLVDNLTRFLTRALKSD
jgi:AcrR family transcriptional regulator